MLDTFGNEIKEGNSVVKRSIAGFWKRIIAFLLDCVIIFLIGRLLGMLLDEQLTKLGLWGPLVGFCVCVLYFGILDSSIGKGQTFGKKVLRLQVVNGEGGYISPKKSFIRAAILAAPVGLDALNAVSDPASPTLLTIIGSVYFLFLISFLYFYIFNRITRQSTHDLAAGAYVVKAETIHGPVNLRIWPKHYVVFSAIALLIVIGGFSIKEKTVNSNDTNIFGNLRQEISKINGVDNVDVHIETRSRFGSGHEVQNLIVTVLIHDRTLPIQSLEDSIAKIILKKLPPSHGFDVIRIRISHGYDIGIAKGYQMDVAVFSPQNPTQRIRAVERSW